MKEREGTQRKENVNKNSNTCNYRDDFFLCLTKGRR